MAKFSEEIIEVVSQDSVNRFLESLTNTVNKRLREIDEEQKEMQKIVNRMQNVRKTHPN